jgi:hypothetical protein
MAIGQSSASCTSDYVISSCKSFYDQNKQKLVITAFAHQFLIQLVNLYLYINEHMLFIRYFEE